MNKVCDGWDESARKCKHGFIATTPLCWGQVRPTTTPQCLMDDPPAHLTRDDGLPLGWSLIERQQAEGSDQ